MIKVNLLKTRVTAAGGAGESTYSTTVEESSQARGILVKVFLLAIGTVGLMLIESENVNRLRDKNSNLNIQIQQLDAELTQKTTEAEGLNNVEQEAKELEDKLKLLKKLSLLRLREVKTLDFMQSSIPDKVWLKAVTYEGDKFNFVGAAMATSDLSDFVKRLEDSRYLRNVIVVRDREADKASGRSNFREYEFTAMSEY